MKIKLQDYGLISIEWIDNKIEAVKKASLKIDGCITKEANLIIVYLKLVKQQLIPSEKLAEKCINQGIDIESLSIQPSIDKQSFLTSEIEIL